jgi:hypothetical protein
MFYSCSIFPPITSARMADEVEAQVGYLAEFDFIREGMRQDQRERQAFLGFSLAASGVILGLLMRASPARTPTQACFLVGLAAIVTIVAEELTIRASQGVASAGAYLRVFVEPHVTGLLYQGRNARYLAKAHGRTSASRGFGIAYGALSAAFVLAWFAAPVNGGRELWQTSVVSLLGLYGALRAGGLIRASYCGWPRVNEAWRAVAAEENGASRPCACSKAHDGVPRITD